MYDVNHVRTTNREIPTEGQETEKSLKTEFLLAGELASPQSQQKWVLVTGSAFLGPFPLIDFQGMLASEL